LELTAAELRRVERERSRSDKLEALGTLAGGAAHELATPLSTIAVVANEMTRMLQEAAPPPALLHEDVALIRAEVDHCQTILQRMTGRAGQWMAEEHTTIDLQRLVELTRAELTQAGRVQWSVPPGAADVVLCVPGESVAQGLRGLLQNALDATADEQLVRFSAEWDDQSVHITVQDSGTGMAPDVLARAGEPFFTTKEPGRGMGLGLFLTRTVIERLGGQLQLDSVPGQGVTAAVTLPRRPLNSL
jgi:two-component system sensor histidine kinase RegB